MKILRITESQYKRLVRGKKLLNEQHKKIVYLDPKDVHDLNPEMIRILDYINYKFDSLYNKPLYVLKIEDGKVYIDTSKYTKEEIDYVKNQADILMKSTSYSKDTLIDGEDFAFDSGIDSDYDWSDEDITVVDDDDVVVDDDDVVVDDDDVVVDDDDVVVDYEPDKTYNRTEYINLIKDIAINQMKKHKIPASITIAQAVLESGNGNSGLSREGKNHFGVKCHGWSGEKIYLDTEEEDANGNRYTVEGDCFRKYDKIEGSFEDHSKFLKNNSRYNSLFNLDITDYKGWSNGLQNAGYASSSKYAKTLINIIEKNNLQQYDGGDNTITDCESCLTKIETKTYNENVNDENVKDFRWWINQDSNRLKSVTDKLKECCETKSDPTISTSYNKKNDHTIIAFSVVGNEWINSGKPSKPKEGNVTFFSPSKLGWVPRGNDGVPYGSGDFGAGRGGRPHLGFDVKSNAGDDIYSPMDGYVTNVNGCAYNNCSNPNLKKIKVVGTGEYSGYKITLLYVKSDLKDGDVVERGQVIAKQQSLHQTYSEKNRNGEFLMTNHVHVHFYDNGVVKNANDYSWTNEQSSNSQNNNNDEEIIDSSIIEENSNLPNNFDKVPVGTNVFRSNQPSLSQLKYILNNYDIDTVVRMNGEEGTGVTPEDEKELVESMGKIYVFQNAHINEGGGFGYRGYETGKGYVGSLNVVQPILKQGNVLIHCTAGADRTGYQVGRFMKDNGFCGNPDTESCRKSLWDYTTKYNSWEKYIPEGREGYIRYMEAFYPYDKWKIEVGK